MAETKVVKKKVSDMSKEEVLDHLEKSGLTNINANASVATLRKQLVDYTGKKVFPIVAKDNIVDFPNKKQNKPKVVRSSTKTTTKTTAKVATKKKVVSKKKAGSKTTDAKPRKRAGRPGRKIDVGSQRGLVLALGVTGKYTRAELTQELAYRLGTTDLVSVRSKVSQILSDFAAPADTSYGKGWAVIESQKSGKIKIEPDQETLEHIRTEIKKGKSK